MHFVSGGAYNGKANWIKTYYELNKINNENYHWISAYDDKPLPEDLSTFSGRLIIIEGIEQWILQLIERRSIDEVRREFEVILKKWYQWAEDEKHRLIIIGTDISKGIVPIDDTLRKWRDVTGFIYQDIVKNCHAFHYVWYGIGKQLK